jgi:hypothetical protein
MANSCFASSAKCSQTVQGVEWLRISNWVKFRGNGRLLHAVCFSHSLSLLFTWLRSRGAGFRVWSVYGKLELRQTVLVHNLLLL